MSSGSLVGPTEVAWEGGWPAMLPIQYALVQRLACLTWPLYYYLTMSWQKVSFCYHTVHLLCGLHQYLHQLACHVGQPGVHVRNNVDSHKLHTPLYM